MPQVPGSGLRPGGAAYGKTGGGQTRQMGSNGGGGNGSGQTDPDPNAPGSAGQSWSTPANVFGFNIGPGTGLNGVAKAAGAPFGDSPANPFPTSATMPPGGSYGGGGAAPPSTNGTPSRSDYQYGSNYGDASQTEGAYASMAQVAQGQRAPRVADPFGGQDQGRAADVMGRYNGLENYYGGVLSGKTPSLAQAQFQQNTDAGIREQMAMANSAHGPLGTALAARNAQVQGVGTQQAAAGQALIGRIQEQGAAAQGLGSTIANQGQFSTGEQGLNQTLGIDQAQIAENQNALNAQTGLAYNQLGQGTALAQLGAGNDYTKAQLAEQTLQQQQNQFNTAQQNNQLSGWLGAAGAGLGILAAADVKMREPGGDAGFTLREENNFILAKNDRTGEIGKVRLDPLTPTEKRQAMAPHGADAISPLFGDMPMGHALPIRDPRTGSLYAADLPLAGMEDAPQLSQAIQGSVGAPNAYGAYTPAAGPSPGGIAGTLQGSNLSASLSGMDPKTRKAILGASQSLFGSAVNSFRATQAPPVPDMSGLLGGG